MSQRLGDLLVKEKVISPEQLEPALKAQKESPKAAWAGSWSSWDTYRTKMSPISSRANTAFLPSTCILRDRFGGSKADPRRDRKALSDTSAEPRRRVAHHRHGGPHQRVRHGRYQVHDRLQHRAGGRLRKRPSWKASRGPTTSRRPEENLEDVMASMWKSEADVEVQAEAEDVGLAELEKGADEAPIVKLVNMILTDAVKRGRQRHPH